MQCLDGPGRPYSLPPLTTPRCANKRGPPAGPPAPTLMAFYHPLPFLVGLAPAAFHSSPGKRRLGEGGSPGLSGGVQTLSASPAPLADVTRWSSCPILVSIVKTSYLSDAPFNHTLLSSPLEDPCFFRFASWAVLTAEIKLTKQQSSF